MKMLDEIVEGAVDDGVSLTSLLRKCLIVADSLKNEKLKTWVLAELNGYPDAETLPDYRVLGIHAEGYFVGSFGRSISNQPLPAFAMKEEHRHWATTANLMQPISAYEGLTSHKGKNLAVQWPGDLVAIYQSTWFPDQGFVLNRAHQVIPPKSLTGVVDQVRNKLLELSLELRNEIGSAEATPQNPPPAVVDKQVTQIIYGGQTNVYGGSIGGDVNQGINQTVVKGDFISLSKSLEEIGIPAELLPNLKAALEEDQELGTKKGLGPKTSGWLKSTLKSIGKGALKVSAGVAEKVATDAILEYLGQGASLTV